MTYTGRCACGQVSLTIEAEPVGVRQCWCRSCQQASGGGPAHNAMFPTEAVTLDGELAQHSYVADSGNMMIRAFCAACHTPVIGYSPARPHLRSVRLGMLDAGHGLSPQAAIWTAEAPAWAVIDPALERHEGQPPAPAKK
jgi:hypothetical protein